MKKLLQCTVAFRDTFRFMFDYNKYVETPLQPDYLFSKKFSAQTLFIVPLNCIADTLPYRKAQSHVIETVSYNYQCELSAVGPSALSQKTLKILSLSYPLLSTELLLFLFWSQPHCL